MGLTVVNLCALVDVQLVRKRIWIVLALDKIGHDIAAELTHFVEFHFCLHGCFLGIRTCRSRLHWCFHTFSGWFLTGVAFIRGTFAACFLCLAVVLSRIWRETWHT